MATDSSKKFFARFARAQIFFSRAHRARSGAEICFFLARIARDQEPRKSFFVHFARDVVNIVVYSMMYRSVCGGVCRKVDSKVDSLVESSV